MVKENTSKVEKCAADAVKVISDAALAAATAIAGAAKSAAEVVSNTAADKAKNMSAQSMADHNLIIRLDTKIDAISANIQDLKDGTSKRIDDLENNKLDVKDSYRENFMSQDQQAFKDLDSRLTTLENAKVTVTVMLSIASAIMTSMIGLIIYHILQTK